MTGMRRHVAVLLLLSAAALPVSVGRAVARSPAVPDSVLFDAVDLSEIVPPQDRLGCSALDELAFGLAPRLVYAARVDLLHELILLWEDRCGVSEPLERVRLLASIWDGAFDEGLYDEDIIDRLVEWDTERTAADHSELRRGFDAFTAGFADQLLPHVPDAGPEQFFCLFYSNRPGDAWDLLDSQDMEDSWLRFYRDDELARLKSDDQILTVAVTSGIWSPAGNLAFAGDHALIGGQVEQRRERRFLRLAFDVRLGRTLRPYQVDSGEISARSDRFNAVYIGIEGGVTVVTLGPAVLDVFAGLGYDGVQPFKDEDVLLGTLNVNLGTGLRVRPFVDRPWLAVVDARREFLSERNEGVDSMSGTAWSLRVGLGWVFDRGRAGRAAALRR